MTSTMLSITQAQIDKVSASMIGLPYKKFGRNVDIGLDCWGLVLEFYRRLGIQIDDPILLHATLWFKGEENYVAVNQKKFFVETDAPKPLCVVSMTVQSKVPNHLAVMIDNTYLLNTDERVGAHKIRLFAVRDHVQKFYQCKLVSYVDQTD